MAEENENELEMDGGGKSKKMLIIIIAVVVLVLGGGGAFFFLSGGEEVTEEQMNAELASGSDEAPAPADGSAKLGTAVYVPMPRPFRFNVPGAARDRFVEIRVQLLVRGGDSEEEAKKHIPLIESTLLNVFAQSNADDLATSAGKTSLKQSALAEVQREMNELSGSKIVEKVLFTGFVMQ